jgi:undecaprenyl-diphosphatase
MRIASHAGDGYAYAAVGALVAVLDPGAAARLLSAGLLGFAFELIVQKLIKHAIRRPRPCHAIPEIRNLVRPPDAFSFPSGHTAGAFLMATLVGQAFPAASIPAYGLSCVIGLSRVYNGVHYPGDVIAGCVLGIASAAFGLFLIG